MLDPKIACIPRSVFREASGEAGRTRSPMSHPLSPSLSLSSHSRSCFFFSHFFVCGRPFSCLHPSFYFFLTFLRNFNPPLATADFLSLLVTTTYNTQRSLCANTQEKITVLLNAHEEHDRKECSLCWRQ